ncbi:MAG TPA: acyltransferase [Stenomitos sp.]
MGLIRLTLAMTVLLVHCWPQAQRLHPVLIDARFSVELFFIISGFFMTLVLNTKYPDTAKGALLFLRNRAVRLFPTYWLVLLASIVWIALLRGFHVPYAKMYVVWADPRWPLNALSALLVGFSNLFFLGQDALFQLGVDASGALRYHGAFNFHPGMTMSQVPAYWYLMVPPAWSVALESSFYLVAPFLLRRRIRVLAGVAALSLAVRIALFAMGLQGDTWDTRFLPSNFVLFCTGAIICRLAILDQRVRIPQALGPWGMALVPLLIALHVPLVNGLERILGAAAEPMVLAVTFALLIVCMPAIVRTTKGSKLDRLFADLAYPVFITHHTLLIMLRVAFGRDHWIWQAFTPYVPLLVVGISLGVVFGFYRPVYAWSLRVLDRPGKALVAGPTA